MGDGEEEEGRERKGWDGLSNFLFFKVGHTYSEILLIKFQGYFSIFQ